MIKESFIELFHNNQNNHNEIISDDQLLAFSKNIVLKYKSLIPSLFRYSIADYYNIRALENESLFLSPIGTMNDIFEGLSCDIDDSVIDKIEEIKDVAYIKSFSESKDDLLMWAHYSDNYAGMCVEYDFSKLSENILYHLFPVYYSDNRFAHIDLNKSIEEHCDLKRMNCDHNYPNECEYIKNIMSLFLTKSNAWSYEKEWRMVATYPQIHNTAEDLYDNHGEMYGINAQTISVKSCIKSVYLGPRMKQNIKEHIIEICKTKLNNIPVYSTRLSKTKYQLEQL